MDIIKKSKVQWKRNDGENIGHDKYEWGKIKNLKKTQIIEIYDVKWNKNKCITCGKNYEFIESEFCSKNCYKNYFVPKLN